MRVGVIGTGFGARVVAPAFSATPGCEVVAVVSARDASGVERLCARSDVDLVSVHSPPFLHAAHIRAALRQRHAVLCDKPLGLDAAECDALRAEAEEAGVVHLVNFEFRHDPIRRRLRELVCAGRIGAPHHVTWLHHSAGSREPLRPFGWLFRADAGGGWIRAWASHAVDSIRWLFGDVADAIGQRRVDIASRPDADGVMHDVDVEDGLHAWLRTSTGVSVVMDSTFAAAVSLAPRIVVLGNTGALECVNDARLVVRPVRGRQEEIGRPHDASDPHMAPMARFAEVVRDVVAGDRPAAGPDVPTFADAAACARVLDQLRATPLIVRA